ncbi:MAG: cysteine desulfurase [Saprospiraceae bacterium]|nr:cysteine desulfurase [Saprospiraceae bacterium]MCB1724712.1 cysteine desulfurase [Gammaproteobacteria bacterium]MCP5299127.1 cysteine desulfurase [Chromatiaceae bacterium]
MSFSETLYFDHQASTPVDRRVFQKMSPFFAEMAGNPHSSDHALGWKMSAVVETARTSVAGLIGAEPDEIIFTSGASESNNLAILGLGRRAAGRTRQRILVSAIEHKCVLAAARALADQCGFTVEVLPVDSAGRVSVAALEGRLADDVLLVSVMAVNNEIGTIQDIRGLAAAAHKVGAVFHCDAAQAPLALDTRHLASAADLVSLSAHKMYGPQGIGALYMRRDLHERIEPLIYGGGQQEGLRSGTLPVALCVGMGEAAGLLCIAEAQGLRERLRRLMEMFVGRISDLPWETRVNGPALTERHPGNANIAFVGFSAHDILQTLQPHLAASTGSACTTGIPEPSHVLRAIGLSGDMAEASIRFSLGAATTEDEIERAVSLIRTALQQLSEIAQSA